MLVFVSGECHKTSPPLYAVPLIFFFCLITLMIIITPDSNMRGIIYNKNIHQDISKCIITI